MFNLFNRDPVSDPASGPVPSSVAFPAACADGHHAWAAYMAAVGRCWITITLGEVAAAAADISP